VAQGSQGNRNWYYNDSSSNNNFGNGNVARCTVPSGASGTGNLNFNNNNDNNNYNINRNGACASWSINFALWV